MSTEYVETYVQVAFVDDYIVTEGQGTWTYGAGSFFDVRIPLTYDGTRDPKCCISQKDPYTYVLGAMNIEYPSWWKEISEDPYKLELIVTNAEVVEASVGSIDITIKNSKNEPLETFVAVPGELNTAMLANGDYADIAIPVIFNQLNKYIYPESMFNSIQYTLSASFSALALEQSITERILLLSQQLAAGQITLDQFQTLVEQGNEEYAGEYGKYYVNNYVKLQTAIVKFQPLLVWKPSS